jgi:hypothetical protein
MKKSILIFIAFLFAFSIFAQSPHMFNYQAVVRSPTGDILANQNVSFEIVILQTSPTGTPVYTETHNTATNEYGLVTLKIGDGATSDDLSAIDWGADDYFMKVSMDEEGGTNYQEMGTTQLLSVPYSLYSETAENIADNSVTSPKILDGEVNDDDIAFNYAASSSKGGPATSIADNSVSSAKILDGEVSDDDIAFNYAASSSKGGPATSIANDVVSSSKILDGEVRAADIGDGATLTEILDDDGSGSGLDADLLDGESMGFYRNASNINSGTLSNSQFSAYQDLYAEKRMGEIKGTTHATNYFVDFVLPDPWTVSNTRIISVEIYRNSSYWSGLGYTLNEADIGIRYFMWNASGNHTIRVMYPDNSEFKGRSIRILMIRTD